MFGHQDEPKSTNEPSLTPSSPVVNAPFPALAGPPATAPTLDTDVTLEAAPTVVANTSTTSGTDLLDIKQKALQQLSPLVGHLEQSPEEKFRTTMMMIQAADNQDLIGTAYEAAQAITDEKARAQALLDIVNEINYFTQHPAK